jgi:acetyl-CoA carboxylase biotin carboxylase subunit
VRVDAGYAPGNVVSQHYDPLLAKLILHGQDREQALARASDALGAFVVTGPKTNLPFHGDLIRSAEFSSGDYDTSVVTRLRPLWAYAAMMVTSR